MSASWSPKSAPLTFGRGMAGVYVLLDLPTASLSIEDLAGALLVGGVSMLQVRAKNYSGEQRFDAILRIAGLCGKAGVPLIVNDDLTTLIRAQDAGLAVAGLHLGQGDLTCFSLPAREDLARRGLLFGLSTHDTRQVHESAVWRPDYLGFGPVYSTRSKHDADPKTGLEGLRSACVSLRAGGHSCPPVVAIGGIDHQRAPACIAAGAAAVAVISCVQGQTVVEVETRTRDLVRAISSASP